MKKKWFFVILALVVIGIVLAIVFINLFKPRDTKELALKVHEVSQSGYLNSEDEKNQKIDQYLKLLKDNSELSDAEKNTVNNYLSAYGAFEIAIKFFDRHVVFAQATDTYQNKLKNTEREFDKAQNCVDKLDTYLKNNLTSTGESQYWQSSTWTDCQQYMQEFVTSTANAFDNLADIYMASMPKVEGFGVWNNDFSDIVMLGMKTLNAQIKENAKENPSFGFSLLTFVDKYLSESGEKLMLRYQSSSDDIRNIVTDIKTNGDKSNSYEQFMSGRLSF